MEHKKVFNDYKKGFDYGFEDAINQREKKNISQKPSFFQSIIGNTKKQKEYSQGYDEGFRFGEHKYQKLLNEKHQEELRKEKRKEEITKEFELMRERKKKLSKELREL